MVSYRAWQEITSDKDKYEETRVVSIFPIDRGFLITMRCSFKDKKKPKETFGHNEVTFFASFEQANEISQTLLTHIRGKLNQPNAPGPDDPVSGA